MHHFLVFNLGLPAIDLVKGTSVRKQYLYYKQFLGKSPEEIREYQHKRLSALLTHAYENVPFYRKRFDEAGFHPETFTGLDQLKQIPPLTRDDIQNNFDTLYDKKADLSKCRKGSSSGSTGIPVFYLHDIHAQSAGTAAGYFGWSISGWRFGDKGLHIWGNPRVVNVEWEKPASKIKANIIRHHKFPAYKLTTDDQFRALANLIAAKKYEFIDGYTNALYLLSKYIKDNNMEVPRLRYVLPTGENLQDYMRSLIEEVFGPVYDTYGCGEIKGISHECCQCGSYHVLDPHVVVEYSQDIITDDGSAALLITDLDSFTMPLIRYQNDDMGKPGINNCKVPFSTMEKVTGRVSDMIDLPSGGRLVVPSFFGSMLLKQVTGIKQYQIEKIRKDLIRINFVVDPGYSPDDEKIVQSSLEEYLGGKIKWELVYVDSIDISDTGKFKLLIDKTNPHE